MTTLRDQLVHLLKTRGLERRDRPFTLSSGEQSYDFVDCKHALATGSALWLAARALLEAIDEPFDAVGGLTMGADPLAHAAAVAAHVERGVEVRWFSVRTKQKDHGTMSSVEGARLAPGTRVLLVDEAVTTGGSILQALDAVLAAGAVVVTAACLVDRGEIGRRIFGDRGIPYVALTDYRDLGIAPVGPG